MEHMRIPFATTRSPPVVPYVCREKRVIKGEDWLQHVSTSEVDGWDTRPDEYKVSILQSWLFFGLLKVFFGKYAPPSKFVEKRNGRQVVHTKSLLVLVSRAVSSEIAPSGLSWDYLGSCIRKARRIYWANCRDGLLNHCNDDGRIEVFLSFAALGQCLQNILQLKTTGEMMSIWEAPWVPAAGPLQPFKTSQGRVNYFQHLMFQVGWCPSRYTAGEMLSFETLFYWSHMSAMRSQQSHENCNLFQCAANQIDQNISYEVQHNEPDCSSCPMITVSSERLCSILEHGKIPLVRIWRPNSCFTRIELEEGDDKSKYVAISHVWSHGLGNPDMNGLPRCQLLRLSQIAAALPETPLLFWIDTICCPVVPAAARKLAIQKMRETYTKADYVLIIDKSLKNVDIGSMERQEVALRVLGSDWASRLWTWQEGVLGANHLFLTETSIFSASFLRQPSTFVNQDESNLRQGKLFDKHSGLWLRENGWSYEGDAERISRQVFSKGRSLAFMANNLRCRSTTYKEDEPICLGSLLNIDMTSILNAEPARRMSAFWLSLPPLTKGLAFWQGTRLCDHQGLNWAPATFLGQPTSLPLSAFDKPESAFLTSRGLKFQSAGLIISGALQELPIYANVAINPPRPLLSFVDDATNGDLPIDHLYPLEHKDFTVPAEYAHLTLAFLISETTDDDCNDFATMVFISSVDTESNTIYAHRGATAELVRSRNSANTVASLLWKQAGETSVDLDLLLSENMVNTESGLEYAPNVVAGGRYISLSGQPMNTKQWWCID